MTKKDIEMIRDAIMSKFDGMVKSNPFESKYHPGICYAQGYIGEAFRYMIEEQEIEEIIDDLAEQLEKASI